MLCATNQSRNTRVIDKFNAVWGLTKIDNIENIVF
jgi:hypothetical protein